MTSKMIKKDYIIIIIMTILYLILALFNLGDFTAPQTGWVPEGVNREFLINFESEKQLDKIMYYCGLGQDWYSVAALDVYYLDEDENYSKLTSLEKAGSDMFKWKQADVDVVTSSLKFISIMYVSEDKSTKGARGEFLEIAVYEKDSDTPLKITEHIELNQSTANTTRLFDEQELAVYRSTFMNTAYFDEVYFPRTAYEYINNINPYENTHPPLGKIIIMWGIQLFGFTPFGWRIIGTLIGVAMIPLMYVFGKRVFKTTFLAFVSAFLMMFDFMHFSQTRIGTVDGYLVFFIIIMFYYMNKYFMQKTYEIKFRYSIYPLIMCGIFFGLAASVKWIGLYAGAGIAFMFFLKQFIELRENKKGLIKQDKFFRKTTLPIILLCFVFFIIIPVIIYYLTYIPVFNVTGSENSITDFISSQKHMFSYHSGVVTSHPYGSPWWQWPANIRPVYFYQLKYPAEGMWGAIASFGNPLIWWSGFICLLTSIVLAWNKKDKRVIFIFAAYLSLFLPWAIAPRKITFLYHYFACVPFMIFAITYNIEHIIKNFPKHKKTVYMYLFLVALLFVVFYPALSGIEVPLKYIESLRWLPSWFF